MYPIQLRQFNFWNDTPFNTPRNDSLQAVSLKRRISPRPRGDALKVTTFVTYNFAWDRARLFYGCQAVIPKSEFTPHAALRLVSGGT